MFICQFHLNLEILLQHEISVSNNRLNVPYSLINLYLHRVLIQSRTT